MMVREAMADPSMRAELEDLYEKEVLPVFSGIGMEAEARGYREALSLTGSAIPFSITASLKSSLTTKPRRSGVSAD